MDPLPNIFAVIDLTDLDFDPNEPRGETAEPERLRGTQFEHPGRIGEESIRGFGQYQADLALRCQIAISRRIYLGCGSKLSTL